MTARASVRVTHPTGLHARPAVKLAKGFASDPLDPDPPPATHLGFVKLLQSIKGDVDIRRFLGYRDVRSFRSLIDSLLPLAREFEQLAPSIAGRMRPCSIGSRRASAGRAAPASPSTRRSYSTTCTRGRRRQLLRAK